jgi:hypothetical protein
VKLSFQRTGRDVETAELEQLAFALREVARLAGQCADHARSRAARDRLLRIESRFDGHLRRLMKRVPHESGKLSEPRIRLGAL